MTQEFLFRNLQLLDPRFDEVRGGYEVLVEGEKIREVVGAADQGRRARPRSTAAAGR